MDQTSRLEAELESIKAELTQQRSVKSGIKKGSYVIGGLLTALWLLSFLSVGAGAGTLIGIFVVLPVVAFLAVVRIATTSVVAELEKKEEDKITSISQAYFGDFS